MAGTGVRPYWETDLRQERARGPARTGRPAPGRHRRTPHRPRRLRARLEQHPLHGHRPLQRLLRHVPAPTGPRILRDRLAVHAVHGRGRAGLAPAGARLRPPGLPPGTREALALAFPGRDAILGRLAELAERQPADRARLEEFTGLVRTLVSPRPREADRNGAEDGA
ncbi:hypothetical protein [Streptomyces thioluteus]|uniref:hypothetical protein n=1 Tax=Streptomyces thioluteus TaxID=66431 RepID=UPI0031ED0D61